MHGVSDEYSVRVAEARWRAMRAPRLTWHERVLLAAAEAADACVARPWRAEVACAVADHVGAELRHLAHVRALREAVAVALAAAGLAGQVPGSVVSRLAWRLAFDLWGGPDR